MRCLVPGEFIIDADLLHAFKILRQEGLLELTKPENATMARHASHYSGEDVEDLAFFYSGPFDAIATQEGQSRCDRTGLIRLDKAVASLKASEDASADRIRVVKRPGLVSALAGPLLDCIAMYNACLGLRENPFSLSPDPAFFYRSPHHEEAFANLIYGVESRKGFIALTGEVGTGKTTVLECLRDCLRERDVGYITVSNSRLSAAEFFELIAYELRCEGGSKTEVLFSLNQLLVQEAQAGRTIVLIVDEAQNLERDVLEEIRLLGNLEDRRGKLLQIVLAGQPELDRKLDEPDLRQLKQRIVLRCSLRPFTEKETFEYIATRLERAGMPHQTVFSPEVLAEIHRQSKGVPRVINAICDNLLLMTSAVGGRVATPQMLARVGEEMRLDAAPRSSSSQSNSSDVSPAVDSAENAAITR